MYVNGIGESKRIETDIVLWRYMSFSKFVSLLHTEALYFTRVDQFADPYEGAFPKADLNILHQPLGAQSAKYDKAVYVDDTGVYRLGTRQEQRQLKTMADIALLWRTAIYINCWHRNEHESAGMWDIYARDGDGIAVQSTLKRLNQCFYSEFPLVQVGDVEYFDYEKDSLAIGGEFYFPRQVLAKRKSYEHEREVRAYIVYPMRKRAEIGIYARCNLAKLIQRVYVSPTSPHWFYNGVRATMRSFGLKGNPVQSDMLSDPPW